jgi:hypothetical protein
VCYNFTEVIEMLKLKVIACDVLNREISYLASRSQCYVDTTYLHQGLHNTPEKLQTMLQEAIDKANEGFPYNYYDQAPHYDYIVLGYGLCSNGIANVSSANVPLVIPRGHDCITLLLGSKERYREYFDGHPGTYWYTAGWIERSLQPGRERYELAYKDYLDRYGEDNAEYLMDMEQGWLREYNNATFIGWDFLAHREHFKQYSKACTEYLNWEYHELAGDCSLMERMLSGVFNEKEFLVVPPGRKVVPSYDEEIIRVE